MAKKKEKKEIVECQSCRYWTRMGETVDGICKVSPYRAYRKENHYCEKAVKNTKIGERQKL